MDNQGTCNSFFNKEHESSTIYTAACYSKECSKNIKIHHVEQINLNQIDVYYNSPYQQEAETLTTVTYIDDGECSDESDIEEESVPSAENKELENTINPTWMLSSIRGQSSKKGPWICGSCTKY